MPKKSVDHCSSDGDTLKGIYLIAIFLWIAAITYYHLTFKVKVNLLGLIILTIPILIWVTGYYNGHLIKNGDADQLFEANFLAVSLLITIPLLAWLSTRIESQEKFIPLVLFAMVLTLLSSLDFWVTPEWFGLSRHIKSILSTSAIVLIIYAIYAFYLVYVKAPHIPFLKT
jgi:hypothetical protein